jgi:hypothetical protein
VTEERFTAYAAKNDMDLLPILNKAVDDVKTGQREQLAAIHANDISPWVAASPAILIGAIAAGLFLSRKR